MTNTIVYTEGENFKADNYTITKNEGKLKITESTKALVIESSTKSWKYDGETHKDEVYTVTYDGTAATADSTGKVFTLSTGDTVTITATAAGVKDYNASYSENNTYTYVISNAGSYSDVTANVGTLSIEKATVTLTSESGEKPYDGTALTKPTVAVSGDGAAIFQTEVSEIKATGSVTTVAEGEVTNTITYTEGANFKADNYTITKEEGKLKITASEAALVITSSTKSWMYDGQTHTDEVYTVTYDGAAATADESGKVFTLSTGDTVTITATAAGVKDYNEGYSENNTYTYVLTNASSYSDVTANVGTLSIEKRSVTLTSESGEKPYDGTALTKPEVTVSGDDIKATGSVTTVAEGEVTNTITYTEGANFKADNYTITKNEGKLKITQREVTVSVADKTVPYNGSEQSGNTATTFANVVSGQTATIGYTPSKGTLVNTYDNGAYADDFKVVDGDGNDVTANYTLGTQTKGKLIITDEDVPDDKVVTKTDGEENDGKKYHIGDTVEWTVWVKNIYDEEKTLVVEEAEGMTITSEVPEKLAAGKEIEITVTHVVTAADVAAGSIKNEVKVKLGDLEKTGDDTVETEKIKITVTAASQTKQYDGTALTNGTFTVTPADPKVPVAEGDTVTATVTGSQTEVGSSANTLSNVKVSNTVIEKDAEGKEVEVVTDVTDAYDITLVNGTLTVTTVPYTINYVFTWPGGAAPAGAPNPPAAATVNRGANYTVSTATYADIPYGIAPNGNVITVLRFQGWDTTGTINNVRSNRTITGAWTIQMVWYTVTYTDGVPGEVVFPDQVTTTLRIVPEPRRVKASTSPAGLPRCLPP